MKAFHFLKYNESTSIDKLIAQSAPETVLCFDLEDSIQDCLDSGKTTVLKKIFREYFRSMLVACKTDDGKLNIGVRINSTEGMEYNLDLLSLSGTGQISTVFLPKVESAQQILKLQNDLQENNISFDEIIPVIETKVGLKNLSSILKSDLKKVKRFAFGHCDYNNDCGNFPFFHQDSREYWTWITKIFKELKLYGYTIVNSPCLQLDNEVYFLNMLNILVSICGSDCAQVTLTKTQTEVCVSYSVIKPDAELPLMGNRLDFKVPAVYIESFIKEFENKYHEKGFVISNGRVLISPQEYVAALNYRKKANLPEINFTFLGGCFPVQGNMPFENRFHQLLKDKVENCRNVKFNINIIRYERFKNCFNKIETYNKSHPIDVLVVSIRPEPVLRLIKLYYKFKKNPGGRIERSLNIPLLNKIDAESYDLLSASTRFNPVENTANSKMHSALVDLNYFFGMLIGNYSYALEKYKELLKDIIKFTNNRNIQLIVLGPPERTNALFEKLITLRLEKDIKKYLEYIPECFVSGRSQNYKGEILFDSLGVYATKAYHLMLAQALYEKILPNIDDINIRK